MKIKDIQKALYEGKKTLAEEQKQILLALEKRQGPFYKQSYVFKKSNGEYLEQVDDTLMIRYLMLMNGRLALIIYPDTLQIENKNLTPAAFTLGDVVPIGEEAFMNVIQEFESELESAISCGEEFEDPSKVPSKYFLKNIYDYIENRRQMKRLYNEIAFGRVSYEKPEVEEIEEEQEVEDDEPKTFDYEDTITF